MDTNSFSLELAGVGVGVGGGAFSKTKSLPALLVLFGLAGTELGPSSLSRAPEEGAKVRGAQRTESGSSSLSRVRGTQGEGEKSPQVPNAGARSQRGLLEQGLASCYPVSEQAWELGASWKDPSAALTSTGLAPPLRALPRSFVIKP